MNTESDEEDPKVSRARRTVVLSLCLVLLGLWSSDAAADEITVG